MEGLPGRAAPPEIRGGTGEIYRAVRTRAGKGTPPYRHPRWVAPVGSESGIVRIIIA